MLPSFELINENSQWLRLFIVRWETVKNGESSLRCEFHRHLQAIDAAGFL